MLVKYIIAQEKFEVNLTCYISHLVGNNLRTEKKILIRILIPDMRSRKMRIKISYNVVLESTFDMSNSYERD